jgi:hypothetical protein
MSDLQSKFNLRTFLVVTAVLFVGTFVTGPSPNFGLPGFSLYSAGAVAGTGVLTQSAGQITSTIPSSTSRQIQLGVKFIF